jgi:hypothetical protein
MATISKGYHKSNEFPNEAFIQQAIEAYFTNQGFQIENGSYSDLKCFNAKNGQRWVIEAKGQTGAIGLDFRTGLGQLLQAMNDPSVCYGLAVPNTPNFTFQCKRVSAWVCQAIQLYWILVGADGLVKIIAPNDVLP